MMNEQSLKVKRTSCWKRRTRVEKWLLLIIISLIILIIIICSIKMSHYDSGKGNTSQNLCFTTSCVRTAADVLESMDSTINPCDDFYNFVCGNFVKTTIIPPYKSTVSSFTVVSDLVDEQMRTLLEESIKEDDPRPFVLVKSIYQACMNTRQIEASALNDLKKILKSAGGWPVLEGDQWRESSFDWRTTSYRFIKLGVISDSFFEFEVDGDVRNSSRKILILTQPYTVSFEKSMRRGFTESIVKYYYDYIVKIAIAFGADPIRAEKEIRDVIDLDIAITRITVPPDERRDPVLEDNQMTIKQMEQEYQYVPWLDYINKLLYPVKEMTYNDVVVVAVPKYFQKLGNLLKDIPKRTVANYMYWKVIKNVMKYLGDDIRNLKLEFSKNVSGVFERTPRWRECTMEATTGLYAASGALYVRHFFNKEAKVTMLELVENFRHTLIENLKNLDWMDEITKEHAIKKAKAMYFHVAYPDELLNEENINNYYSNLTVHPNKYLESMLNLTMFKNQVEFAQMNEMVDKTDWRQHFYAIVINAFYDQNENSIDLPAAILQGVFFNNNRPQYMNYGAIGSIIGHEIIHGYDDEGRKLDKDGNLVDWWQPKTQSAFNAKAQCIIDQYSNFTVPEINMNLDGRNTQGENIADNGGMKQAYLAYKKWTEQHGSEQGLPGLPYTPEQMFWISVARTWCETHRTEQLNSIVMSESHPPSYYRVNVPLINSEYFSKEFDCPLGSKMNPNKKCKFW